MSALFRLQEWYASMCNGDWEHTYGVSISNLDNPGWSLDVKLADTYLYEIEFPPINVQREHDDDWLQCKKENGMFKGDGGPRNLEEILIVFLDWAEKNDNGPGIGK